MILHTDPFIHPAIIIIVFIMTVIMTDILYKRYISVVSRSYWLFLVGAKILALLALCILLLNPSIRKMIPDSKNLQIMIFVDGTESMNAIDCENNSRIDVARKLIKSKSQFFKSLSDLTGNLNFFLFSGNTTRQISADDKFDAILGDTDIDLTLNAYLSNHYNLNSIGAVILMSDGQDNKGRSLMAAAPEYRKAGIPIHCIGIGDPRSQQDISINWKNVPPEALKNSKQKFTAVVKRNFIEVFDTSVTLFENGREIREIDISFSKDELEKEIYFDHVPFTAGFKTYKITTANLANEKNRLNNIDLAGIKINDPDIFNIFYFSANLDWNLKFLKLFIDKEEKFNLDTVIRMGEKGYYVRGYSGKNRLEDNFPSCSDLNQYDSLIVDLSSLYLLDQEQISCLVNFIENRGGGVVFSGMSADLPEEVRTILPLTDLPIESRKMRKTKLDFQSSKIFIEKDNDYITKFKSMLYIPEGTEFYTIENNQTKPGSKIVIASKNSSWVVLSTQHYGAGKVAYLNLNDSWKWNLQLENGHELYNVFWGKLLTWAAAASKEKLAVRPNSTKFKLSEEQELRVDLLNEQFEPENNAEVTCSIADLNGNEYTMSLHPDSKVDGRYLGKFHPRKAGEYRFYFKAVNKNGFTIESSQDYLVVDYGNETQPYPMAEEKLQSLARETGGKYFNYKNTSAIDKLKLSKKINYIETKDDLANHWWFLFVVSLAFLPDWILRRRIGLK